MHKLYLVKIPESMLKLFKNLFLSPVALSIGDFFYFLDKKSESKPWYALHARLSRKKASSRSYQRLGAILGSENKLLIAKILADKALSINPLNHRALTNIGQILYIKNNYKDSRHYLEKAYFICSSSHKACFHLAYLNLLENRIDEALEKCKQSVSLKKWKPALALLIIIYERIKSTELTISTLHELIKLDPSDWQPRLRLGQLLSEEGSPGQAIEQLTLAKLINPCNPKILLELGRAYKLAGSTSLAKECLDECIHLIKDDSPQSLILKSKACIELGQYLESDALLSQAIAKNPNNEEALCLKGHSLIQAYKYDEGIIHLREIISNNPLNVDALSNLGQAYYEVGEPTKALEYLERASTINPNEAGNRWNFGLALLANYEYKKGWEEYEWRWKINDVLVNNERILTFNNPPWDGRHKLIGSELVVLPEQGLGDTIQFSRFVSSLQEYVGNQVNISFFTGPKLYDLVEFSELFLRLSSAEQALRCPNWIPLLSIPRIIGVDTSNSSPKSPYLFANKNNIQRWKRKLSRKNLINVGIHWQGRPETEIRGLRGRSFPLSSMSKLAEAHEEILFVSLQKGYGAEQLNDIDFKDRFAECQDEVTSTLDFLETAAMVMACDLIITSDSALAHLSGALGQTTWLMLAKNAEWRWGTNQEKTHWYPSMRLFRQNKLGDWDEVIQSVSEAFAKWKSFKI